MRCGRGFAKIIPPPSGSAVWLRAIGSRCAAEQSKDYRWSGYAEAVTGDRGARAGLARILENYGESGHWRSVGKAYRRVLFGAGEETAERRGISPEDVAAELARGGVLTTTEMLRCRVRYFTDALAIGSRAFVEEFFEGSRGAFGKQRTSGARKMRGGDWDGLFVARDLQKDVVVPSG